MSWRRQPAGIYRVLLRDALHRTWERKALWVFGLFAALISTGGVMDVAIRSLKRIEAGRDFYLQVLQGTVPGLDLIGAYIQQLSMLDPGRMLSTLVFLTLFGIVLIILALIGQGALIAGASEKELNARKAMHAGGKHIFDLLGLALLSKAATVIAISLATLPLVLFLARGTPQDAVIYVISFLIFFPLIIVIAIITVLTGIGIVREENGLLSSLIESGRIILRHPVACLEFALILFVLVFATSLVTAAILILLSIPYAAILTFALLSGVSFVFIMTHVFGAIVLFTILFAIGGGLVAFQYTAWILFYERALRKDALHRLASKLERLIG